MKRSRVGKFANVALRHLEVGGEQEMRVGRHPGAERDRLVGAVVEHDQQLEIVGAGILDVVAVALRHVAHVARAHVLGARAAVRSEHAQPGAARDVVLPLVGVGVPMHLAQAARLDAHQRAGHRAGDRELALRHQAIAAAGIVGWPLRQQPVAVGQHAAVERARRGVGRQRRRHRSLGDVDLALREVGEGRGRHAEFLLQHLGRGVPDPVA